MSSSRFQSIDMVPMNFGESLDDIPTSRLRSTKLGERNKHEIELSNKNTLKRKNKIQNNTKGHKFKICLATTCLLQICILLAIITFTYHNRWPLRFDLECLTSGKDNRSEESNRLGTHDLSNIYRVYTNGKNSTRILVGLTKNCTQRDHDFAWATKCQSKYIDQCNKLESLAAQVPSDQLGGQRKITVIVTSRSGNKLNSTMIPIKWVNSCQAVDQPHCQFKTRLTVYLNEKQQTIIGWGGALTDSSVNNILSLSVNGTRRLLDDYFSKDRGLGYNMIRISIGGSDFSERFYTNDDIKPGVADDLNLDQFSLREEDTLYKIPILKMVQTEYEQPVKLLASMWSPPLWMKTNHHFNKGQLRGSINTTEQDADRYFRALAELKAKFIEAYQRESVKFWGLTVMNEPYLAVEPFIDFNTMIFPPRDYGAYLANILGPRFRADEALRHIKLIVHDDNRKFLYPKTEPMLRRMEVLRYVDGISTHGYIDENYTSMRELYDKFQRRIFILPDELSSGHLPFMEKALIGNWERAIHYGLDIIRGLQNRAAGWLDWNMVLDTEGGPGWLGGRLDSPVIVDKKTNTYYKSPMFYTIGQFSRYLPEGSARLNDRIINDKYDLNFETVSFLTPDRRQLVTVVLNENPYPIELIIEPMKSSGHIAPAQNSGYKVMIQAESITTILYPLIMDIRYQDPLR